MTERLEALASEPVDVHDKVLHGIGDITLGDVGDLELEHCCRGHPAADCSRQDWEAVLSNVRRMQTYCDAHGCLFAPPWQDDDGSSGVGRAGGHRCVGNHRGRPSTTGVTIAFGVPRVLVANEVTGPLTISPGLAAAGLDR